MSSKKDMTAYLESNINLLKFAGLWVIGDYSRKKSYIFYSAIISTLFVFLDTFCMFLNLQNITDNWEESSSYLTILSVKVMGLTKLMMFIKNRNIISSIMDSLVYRCFSWKNERQRKIVKDSFFLYTISYRIFCTAGFFSFLLYVVLPLIVGQEMVLPFDSWYPYDYKKYPWYLITYGHQVLSTLFITSSNVGVDTISIGLLRVLSCQCEILGDTIENLDEENEDFDDFYRGVAEHHKEILKLAERLNELFSFYVFGQMGLCVLLFCTALFRLSVVSRSVLDGYLYNMIEPGSPECFTLFVFIVSVGFQLFLYCWFGNEVTIQSSKLYLRAFHCNWVGAPLSFQKDLIIFILNTIEPIQIYALYFFPMSITTFSRIMKSSWSYFAVLQQMNNTG